MWGWGEFVKKTDDFENSVDEELAVFHSRIFLR